MYVGVACSLCRDVGVNVNVKVGATSGCIGWDVGGHGEDIMGGVKLGLASLWNNVLVYIGF